MGNNEDFIQARENIYKQLRAELLGPGSEDIGPDINYEVLTESPVQRYSTGILYAQKTIFDENEITGEIVSENEDELDINYESEEFVIQKQEKYYINSREESNEIDDEISMANQTLPSSMGFTFFVKGDASKLNLRISVAKYRSCMIEECCVSYNNGEDTPLKDELIMDYIYYLDGKLKLKKELTFDDIKRFKNEGLLNGYEDLENAIYKLASQSPTKNKTTASYIRQPLLNETLIKIDLDERNYYSLEVVKDSKLQLSILKRNYNNDIKGFTVVLLNTNEDKNNYDVNKMFFQPKISISTIDNTELIFVEYMKNPYFENKDNKTYNEEESLDLLYRRKKIYSSGHGVSVVYEINEDTGKGKIETEYIPKYEVPKLNFNIDELNEISDKVLSMNKLSDISDYTKDELISYLNKFVDAYGTWIDGLETELILMDKKFYNAAKRHIICCREAMERMKKGIDLIYTDAQVYVAFLLTNRAMLMQRAHSKVKERFPEDEALEYTDYNKIQDKDASWRPFQLGFILMCINSIQNPHINERDLVDLIWVPTGGGKTEAYLGVTAFTIFLRRLREPKKGGGTAIIMRYTLRLLAAQQFIRSSILICACELIRREKRYNLGEDPITIGLWIGGESTPNTNEKAKQYIIELEKNLTPSNLENKKEKNNKFQLLKCPWCGTKLIKEVVNNRIKGQWGYRIKNRNMEIYCPEEECDFNRALPIQVVDECIYKKPPTLLFGTVDKFAMITWKEEISSLFGLNNNYLSPELIIQDELHLISGPLGTIVGLYETAIDKMCSNKGTKPKIIASTATIRRAEEQCKSLYTREVRQFPPPGLSAEDSFFTREIPKDKEPGRLYTGVMATGKTQTTIEIRLMATLLQKLHMMDIHDDVKDKYWTLVGYFNSIRELGKCSTLVEDDIKDYMRRLASRLADRRQTRIIIDADELTGRIPSGLIIKNLEKLEINYSKDNMNKKNYASNVLLASNMISVGVDVARLNLMTVIGQPKLTSEYIQATSRVGRTFPGLVVTLYDGARSRDRSHYESFYSYHQSFYKYVEPTSVTPFSEPALDRALHAVLISLMRHIGELGGEEMAGAFEKTNKYIEDIEKFILNRVNMIDDSLIDITKDKMEAIWGSWEERKDSIVGNEPLTYSKQDRKHLIRQFGKKDKEVAFDTLESMRNVDSQSAVNIIVFGGEKNE